MGNKKSIECSTCGGALQRDGSGARCADCGSQFSLVRTAGPVVLAPKKQGQAETALRRAQQRLASLVERLTKLSAGSSQPSFAPNLNPPKSRMALLLAILVPCFILIWVFGGALAAILVCIPPLLVTGVLRSRQMKRYRQEVVEYERRQSEVTDALNKKRTVELEQLQRERNECGDLIHRISERVAPDMA